MNILLETIWFFLPAAIANMAPVFAHHIHLWDSFAYPIDGHITLNGKRLLGDNKTIRGLVVGALAGLITGFLQYLAFSADAIQAISIFPYTSLVASTALGMLLGASALVGDMIKSFFKRRLNIPSGHSWIPFDQIDLALGATIATWWLGVLTIQHVIVALIVLGFGSYLVSVIGVMTKIKKTL